MNKITRSYAVAIFMIAGLIVSGSFTWNWALADDASTSVTVGNAAPTVANVVINPSPIILTENATTTVTITADITDTNGCEDVLTSGSVTAVLYRSGVTNGVSCTASESSCYQSITLIESASSCTGGSDTSASVSGSVDLQYFADATDAGTFSAQNWIAQVTATDASAATGSNTATAEVNTTLALDVTAAVNYGTLAAGADTGATNQTATVENTGNATPIDTQVSGTDMSDGGSNTIAAGQQKYGLTDVTYASLSSTLSTTPATLTLGLAKATNSSTPSTDDTFWGIAIPGGQAAAAYTGTNTFTAVAQ